MAMKINKLNDSLPLQVAAYFFLQIYSRGGFQENKNLFILDGHGSHVIIQALEQATKLGLDMVTLLSHTSHVLNHLMSLVSSPSKMFLKKKGSTMARNNYLGLDKVTLVQWVDKALLKSLKKK
jgi:hypothetical protein